MRVILCGILVFTMVALYAEDAKEKGTERHEWAGVAKDKGLDENYKMQDHPMIRLDKRVWLLRGPGLISLEELKKRRHYVITGKESADGKYIDVEKMVERTQFEGPVYRATASGREPFLMLKYAGDFALELKGKDLPVITAADKNTIWIANGKLSADGKCIEVTEMKKKEPTADTK